MQESLEWIVRPASSGETEEVVRLRSAFVADVRDRAPDDLGDEFLEATERFVRDRAGAGRLRSWFAERDGDLVGVVSVLVTDAAPLPEDLRSREGYVINMYVDPAVRGRGIARSLLDAVLTDALGSDLRRVYLHATDDGRPLYEATGFASDPRWMALRLPLPGAPEIPT